MKISDRIHTAFAGNRRGKNAVEQPTVYLRRKLLENGADLVGFADLSVLPTVAHRGFPTGVALAVKYPKEVIRGISELPTLDYFSHYNRLNEKLDQLVNLGAKLLTNLGYNAFAQTIEAAVWNEETCATLLPHKTVATRAGLGWIGKCALLVTEPFGSMVRLSSLLTDAPLETAQPIEEAKCGDCRICAIACPAGAVKGTPWTPSTDRAAFFDALACQSMAKQRSKAGFGLDATVCGKCIEICPYTRRYLNAD